MKKLLSGLFVALPFLAFSQANYQPGYIVTNEGDTIKGLIDYKERSLNPTRITFKSNEQDPATVYDLTNTRAYGINSQERYRRYKVRMSQSKEQLSQLSIGPDTTTKMETAFLKVLVDGGPVTLYSYNDANKKRFYVQDAGNPMPEELRLVKYLQPDNPKVVVIDNRYLRQLAQLDSRLRTDGTFSEQRWRNVRYLEADLSAAVAKMNGTEGVAIGKKPMRFFVGAALSASTAKYVGDSYYAGSDSKNKVSYSPSLSVGVDLFANSAIKKLIFRAELGISSNKYDITNVISNIGKVSSEVSTYTHTFNEVAVQLSPQVIYNLYNKENFKYFLAAGAALNIASYSKSLKTKVFTTSYMSEKTTIDADPVPFRGVYFTPRVATGVVLNNRWELSAHYILPAAITSYANYNIEMGRVNAGLTYLFGK